MPTPHIIPINIAGCSHELVIEPGGLRSLGARVRAIAPHSKALLAIDARIVDSYGKIARESLERAGYSITEVQLRAEESRKSLDSVREMYAAMLGAGLDRHSPLIAFGGGIVGDTAGFAAATFLRGVPLIQIPTTLLAMVDASIGGKTGVNIELPGDAAPVFDPEAQTRREPSGAKVRIALGKNLIGAFHQPRLILADPETLRTLNDRDFNCGLAECIKHGMIADGALLDFIRDQRDSIAARDPATLAQLIKRSARIKIDIVQRDERETGERALLNLGHTFAHAIESLPELDLRHGEAVATGLVAACECAIRRTVITPDYAAEIRTLVQRCQLPQRIPHAVPVETLMRRMRYDKKARGGRLRLILPVARGKCHVFDDVPSDAIEAAWRAVGAS